MENHIIAVPVWAISLAIFFAFLLGLYAPLTAYQNACASHCFERLEAQGLRSERDRAEALREARIEEAATELRLGIAN